MTDEEQDTPTTTTPADAAKNNNNNTTATTASSNFNLRSVVAPLSSSFPRLLELDRKHVWHPYSAMPGSVPNVLVDSAEGVHLNVRAMMISKNKYNFFGGGDDNDQGKSSSSSVLEMQEHQLVDGMSSWWACIHGYNHPELNAAVTEQLGKMSHVMFGGLTHEPAIQLATKLVELVNTRRNTGDGDDEVEIEKGFGGGGGVDEDALQHVFFCDSGSVAIEVAMKMAQQYWYNKNKPQKNRFLSVKNGYHGDTFQAMSVCDPDTGMHHLFQTVLKQQLFAPQPTPEYWKEFDDTHMWDMHELLQRHHTELAAVILEPIVQGAGGMRFYAPGYLRAVRQLCNHYNVLLIADEIATGFGRTGKQLFACHHANITPDIMCLGKAITGGYMSFAATLTTPHVAKAFSSSRGSGVLMHGPTFMANPLACAVSLASLKLLETTTNWPQCVKNIEDQLRVELRPARKSKLVKEVRVLGAIGVVEMEEAVDMKKIMPAIIQEGVWLRPFGRLLYTMPPFIIEPQQLRKITRAMVSLSQRRF